MAHAISTQGLPTRFEVPNPCELEVLQTLIDGYVQLVECPTGNNVMLVDEDGGSKGLFPNSIASMCAAQPIVGKALLLSKEEWKRVK